MKKLMVCVAGAIAVCLAGCGGAPSASDYEAKLKEARKGMSAAEMASAGLNDEVIASMVKMYKEAPNDDLRKKAYDAVVEMAKKR